tara:strand:- start:366 stop:548 length:183 start_codon:yes stop_codon:yes gene_type:complete
METLNWTEIYAWIFIGCGVWSVMIGSLLVDCWHDGKSIFIEDDISDEEAEGLERGGDDQN